MARAKSARSPVEFAKHYKIDSTGTYGERAAKFLNDAANELPYRFFDKRIVAKISFGLSFTPNERSDYLKRLSSVLGSAEKILMREHNREVWTDRIEGVRATVDDADRLRTKHRRKRRRVKSSIASLEKTDSGIDSSKLDADLKRELSRSRRSLKVLSDALTTLPQLPPAKGRGDQ